MTKASSLFRQGTYSDELINIKWKQHGGSAMQNPFDFNKPIRVGSVKKTFDPH
jgi:hypothetical protein